VLPVDAEDYEKRVAGATDALDVLAARLVGELDEQNGGFPSWVGHSDWKTLTLLSDYLIQCRLRWPWSRVVDLPRRTLPGKLIGASVGRKHATR
jgi:hypothetical protein